MDRLLSTMPSRLAEWTRLSSCSRAAQTSTMSTRRGRHQCNGQNDSINRISLTYLSSMEHNHLKIRKTKRQLLRNSLLLLSRRSTKERSPRGTCWQSRGATTMNLSLRKSFRSSKRKTQSLLGTLRNLMPSSNCLCQKSQNKLKSTTTGKRPPKDF